MTIYKYMKLEYLLESLKYGVYCSKITEVNDPYECEGIENPEYYRIACMTNSNKKMLLWSYYVNHRGCCVEFEVPKGYEHILKEVIYDDSFISREELSLDEIKESLYHKGKEWKHENEYRAVYYNPECKKDTIWKRKAGNVFLGLPVVSVCFGILSHKEEDYAASIKNILEYNDKFKKNIKIQKLKLAFNRYELIYDRQLNVEAEIKKYEHR